MKQLLTADTNKKYRVMTSSKFSQNVIEPQPPTPYFLRVVVNKDESLYPATHRPWIIFANTQKKIIPLYYTISVISILGGQNIEIASPYYSGKQGADVLTQTYDCLTKSFPYTTNVPITDPAFPYDNQYHYLYNCFWDQIQFNETDFFDTSGGLDIYIQPNLLTSMTGVNSPTPIPAGQYVVAITFLYLEMYE